MKRTAFTLLLVLLLFACANIISYDDKLQTFVGQTQQSLIEQWGKPTGQKIYANGEKVLTYTKVQDYYMPTEYFYDTPGWAESDIIYDPFFGIYEFAPSAQIVDTEVEGICQTSFVIKNDVVTAYKWRGNSCH